MAYPDKQSDYSQVIENSFKTLSDNENRKENESQNKGYEKEEEEKQKSFEDIERQDTPGENQGLLKDSPPESHASGDNQEDREEDKNTYQTDKFVINDDINIDLTSARDVLAGEGNEENRAAFSVVNVVAPDKLKVRYFPVTAAGVQGGKKEDKDGTTVKDTKSEKSRNISAKDSRSKGPEFGKKSMDASSIVMSQISDKTKAKKQEGNDTGDSHSATGKSTTEVTAEKGKADKGKNSELNALPIPTLLENAKADLVPEKKPKMVWSGQEVISNYDEYLCDRSTGFLREARIWKKGPKGLLTRTQHFVKVVIHSQPADVFLILCGLANTIILALNRYNQPQAEADAIQTTNTVFTAVFIAEMALKLFSIGIVKYCFDAMNIIDGVVVVLSIVELIFLDSSDSNSFLKSFQAFRILRAFRVIRMVRVLRALKSMKLLIQVISEAITSFAYVGILLILFLFIYALLGMQLFGGNFPAHSEVLEERQNFDSFHKAFLCVYQILTIENWQTLQYLSMRKVNGIFVALYYISWLFIGNYILLNLFLALMLDAFAEVEEANMKTGEDAVSLRMKVGHYHRYSHCYKIPHRQRKHQATHHHLHFSIHEGAAEVAVRAEGDGAEHRRRPRREVERKAAAAQHTVQLLPVPLLQAEQVQSCRLANCHQLLLRRRPHRLHPPLHSPAHSQYVLSEGFD